MQYTAHTACFIKTGCARVHAIYLVACDSIWGVAGGIDCVHSIVRPLLLWDGLSEQKAVH